jgi:peptide/nickel transport system permease protein
MSSTDAFLTAIPLAQIRPAPEQADNAPATAADTPWPNLRAPDAARASTVEAFRLAPAGRHRALRAFLANPTAVLGLAILSLVMTAALATPMLFPDDPLSMVARPLAMACEEIRRDRAPTTGDRAWRRLVERVSY